MIYNIIQLPITLIINLHFVFRNYINKHYRIAFGLHNWIYENIYIYISVKVSFTNEMQEKIKNIIT